MAVKRGGLGKGLDSLISLSDDLDLTPKKEDKKSSSAEKPKEVIKEVVKEVVKEVKVHEPLMVKLREIEPNRDQPRKEFDKESLEELKDSILQYGVLQPLVVVKKGKYYEIVAGERRWRAAKLAGLKEGPVIIKELSEREISEVSLIENIQRENLNPIDEALAFRQLLDNYSLKQEDVATKVGKSRAYITNSTRLLKLPENVRGYVAKGELSTGHAKVLLGVEDPALLENLAKDIVEHKLSVRDTEKLVKAALNPKKPKPEIKLDYVEHFALLQDKLTNRMGTKVEIKRKNNKAGKIEIAYFSNEELERILDIIGLTE